MDPLPIYIYYPTANKQYQLNSVSCHVKISDSDFIPLALSTVELSWIELMIDAQKFKVAEAKLAETEPDIMLEKDT